MSFDARLIAARPLSPSVRELVFERADGHVLHFQPGQWVNLHLPLPSGELRRAYSIASPPGDGSSRFEIAITRVGPGSQYLHELAPGASLRATGPLGVFTRAPDEPAPSLFVGTGTGVTPLLSMIRAALAWGSTAPLFLLFGVRCEEDILYRPLLDQLTRAHANLRCEVTLSRPSADWAGRCGYVQAHLTQIVAELRAQADATPPRAFVCGLDRMVSSVRDTLRDDLGFERKRVHAERYDPKTP